MMKAKMMKVKVWDCSRLGNEMVEGHEEKLGVWVTQEGPYVCMGM